jgi:threonine dehydratase
MGVLPKTPMLFSARLSQRWGRSVHVKYENVSAIRSFKARGALYAVAQLSPAQRNSGVVTASTGNHGQGVAFAGRHFGVPVTVVVPEGVEPAKLDAIRNIGPDLRILGQNLTEAEAYAEDFAKDRGALFIEDGENADLMAGAASVASEMLDEEPSLDSLIVPVGGGNLIAGALLAVSRRSTEMSVVGVQSVAAPGATKSWLAGSIQKEECETFAGGLATEHPGERSLAVMTSLLHHMVLVTEEDLWSAMAMTFGATGAVIEGAAAAGVAALERFGDEIPGERVGVILTGGWVSRNDLLRALATYPE